MKIKWEVEINPNSRGTFFRSHNNMFAFYDDRLYYTYFDVDQGVLIILDFDISSGDYRTRYISDSENVKLLSTSDIKYYSKGNQLLLCTNNNTYNISKSRIKKMRKDSLKYVEHIPFEYRKYSFANLLVHFPSPRTIECVDSATKKQVWKHSLKGYPYTAIENINNHLFFGTAGKGGALYCIQLDNGEIKRDFSTKGTANYCWHKDNIITYTDKGHLQILDPYSNKQIELFEMDTQIGKDVPMVIVNDCLYTITFSRKNKDIWPKPTYVLCIDLLEDDTVKRA